MKKFLILFVVMVYSCGNTSYFEDVGIPAREDKRGDYGIVNLDGDIVVDFELDNRPSIMVENWAYFENTNGSINYVNNSSKIVETTHESSLLFNEGHVVVRLSDGQLAILDSNLNLVKTLVGIQEAGSLSEGLIKVKNSDGLWGFTNLENQEVVRSKYFNVNSYREGLAIVMQKVEGELLHGVIDKQGNEVIPMTSKYDYLTSFSEGLCVFEKDGRIGYLNAERKEVKVEVLEVSEGEVAGIKGATLKISGDYAFGYFRTETGIHRLVRKSPFDSGSRRHTSFAGVNVYPEIDESIEIDVNPSDLRIDTYRASGAGGQHINKTDSAVRITHIPSNTVVQCQNDRSQHRNKAEAMNMLKAQLYSLELNKRNEEKQAVEDAKTDIGWGQQIRNYVLDQSRIKDLRTSVEIGNTQGVLDGDLDPFISESLKQGV